MLCVRAVVREAEGTAPRHGHGQEGALRTMRVRGRRLISISVREKSGPAGLNLPHIGCTRRLFTWTTGSPLECVLLLFAVSSVSSVSFTLPARTLQLSRGCPPQ